VQIHKVTAKTNLISTGIVRSWFLARGRTNPHQLHREKPSCTGKNRAEWNRCYKRKRSRITVFI